MMTLAIRPWFSAVALSLLLPVAGYAAEPGAAAGPSRADTLRMQGQPRGRAVSLSAGQIAENPAQHYGQSVRVSAQVNRVLNPQLFTLDEDELFAGPDVLVFAPVGSLRVDEDDELTVTGTLRKLVVADLDAEYGEIFAPDMVADYRDRPILVADSIRTEDGRELLRTGKIDP